MSIDRIDRPGAIAPDHHDSTPPDNLSRRIFLKAGAASGGGLMLGFSLPAMLGEAMAAGAGSFTPNAFIRIGGDRSVTLTMPYVEIGHGNYTSLPLLNSAELEVGLKPVRLEPS